MSIVKKILIAILAGFFVLGVFSVGLLYGAKNGILINNLVSVGTGKVLNKDITPKQYLQDVSFSLYWDLWDTIQKRYYDFKNIKEVDMFYGSLAGMVAALNDPYSVFLSPQVNEEFTDELSGKFEGIGAEIGIRKDQLTIIAPLPDSPAFRAGLKIGDKILAIDGIDTQGMALDKAVSLIRGEKGTKVKLTIATARNNEIKDVEIVRDTINIISVTWEQKDNQTAYIKISYFNEDTFERFRQAVAEALKNNPKNIILDLRGNPGGFLDTAVKIASYWVDNQPVVLEKLYDGSITPFPAVGKPVLKDKKTYILINGGSASASEIIVGALQDYNLATVVGEQSFGKGSVQDLINFVDGSAVKLTVVKWLTPKSNAIDQVGITPDVVVEMTSDDYDENRDPQLDKVLELIKEN